ncbi:nucleoside hydrolase [Tissierella sp. MB52-C2]|uniref:nucleoside hydrolase n=1 Tax=Tissierella sp. MB52-C2 TaxID=3070999 RepID=UPI00280BAB1A|nr:nucleoside hydrolase [Tissierella sp. MB52-C2]WMM24611.1 nucleoside hydrolase [Tissierella sp. MB52-C2]
MKRPIIIDCDPGLDDAAALVLAHKVESINVLGLTTIVGNASMENTSRNALNLLDAIGWDIPVAKGASQPLARERKLSNKRNGLGKLVLQESEKQFYNIEAVDFIYNEATKNNGQLEILSIGPMTNIANTLLKYPDVKNLIKSITFMGGTTGAGNITPWAEFNMYVDPQAADIVFKSSIPLTMVGLDITKKAFLRLEDIEYFSSLNNIHGTLLSNIFLAIHNRECLWGENNIEVHDAVAFITMILPEIIKKKKFNVSIETNNKEALGSILLDYRNMPEEDKNIDVAVDIDIEGFRSFIKELVC